MLFSKKTDAIELLLFYLMWCELEEAAELAYRRSVKRRRRWPYCRRLCNQNGEVHLVHLVVSFRIVLLMIVRAKHILLHASMKYLHDNEELCGLAR